MKYLATYITGFLSGSWLGDESIVYSLAVPAAFYILGQLDTEEEDEHADDQPSPSFRVAHMTTDQIMRALQNVGYKWDEKLYMYTADNLENQRNILYRTLEETLKVSNKHSYQWSRHDIETCHYYYKIKEGVASWNTRTFAALRLHFDLYWDYIHMDN